MTLASDELLAELVALARDLAGAEASVQEKILSRRSDGPVVRVGDVVVKCHPVETDRHELEARLSMILTPSVRGLFVPPMRFPELVGQCAGRIVSAWPAGTPVDPDRPEAAPWALAGLMLARLHCASVPAVHEPGAPRAGAPYRVSRALDRMRTSLSNRDGSLVVRAFQTLPPWAIDASCALPPDRPFALVHGDFHLGQLATFEQGLRFIDVDDLGGGDPAWDLARPAAWFIVTLIAPSSWEAFLGAYVSEGGPALKNPADPWSTLEPYARAITIQSAALALSVAQREDRPLDEIESSWVEACARIAEG